MQCERRFPLELFAPTFDSSLVELPDLVGDAGESDSNGDIRVFVRMGWLPRVDEIR